MAVSSPIPVSGDTKGSQPSDSKRYFAEFVLILIVALVVLGFILTEYDEWHHCLGTWLGRLCYRLEH